MGDRPVADLVIDAVDMAAWNRTAVLRIVHHSEHGAQYTAAVFGRTLKEAGILGSMGIVGDTLHDASFFGTLKTELLGRRSWPSHHAIASIFECFVAGNVGI